MEPAIRSGLARKLSFTGSTAVGRHLLEQCAGKVLRVSMELGGNAAFIVFPDADVEAAVDGAIQAKMRNSGEACTAANRIFVHADLAEAFGQRLAERMARLTIGRGIDPGVQVGPVIDNAARSRIHALVTEAVSQGAELLTGGHPAEGDGYFYPPTVLTGGSATSRIRSEEIFGPVATITSFTTETEVVAMSNATEYGLAAYLYTNDLSRALRVSEALEVGMVAINQGLLSNAAAPFGGIKASGLGREGGPTGIDEYLETKYIGIALAESP